MGAAATVDAASPQTADGQARCPHLIFHDVLGAAVVGELLAHVERHQDAFRPAVIRSRHTGEARIDEVSLAASTLRRSRLFRRNVLIQSVQNRTGP